jgi:sec-independent protein translocase protein TatA
VFGLGTGELFLILAIVLVIFGVGKLPEIGGALGRGISSFKKEVASENSQTNQESQKPKLDETK